MMRIYMFVSRNKPELRAFSADSRGDRLPGKYAPWDATGVVAAERSPPHGFSRATIEDAINSQGYQLWRMHAPKAGRP